MSYICTKVDSVSPDLAEVFWEAGTDYYLTEGTLPKGNVAPVTGHKDYSSNYPMLLIVSIVAFIK